MSTPAFLVTGVAGFIGSHVAEHLIAAGHRVIGLDDLSGGYRHNVPEGVEFIEGSIADATVVNRIFATHQIERVYHLAAYAAEGLSPFIRHFNYTNNLLGSVNLINASVNAGTVRCFVFTSSMAVYGAHQVPMEESMIPMPEDPYGIAKYGAERDLELAHKQFGLPYVIFRPHNVYGERQNIADRYRNVIGIFMNQVMRGDPMSVYGDGQQTRAFSYISDVAPIIAIAPERSEAYGRIINIGADTPYTITQMAHAVAKAFHVPTNLVHREARNEVTHAWTSHSVLNEIFGDMRHNVPLDVGLARMAAWAQSVGPMTPSRFEKIEIHKGLYSFWKPDADLAESAAESIARAA